MITKLLIKNFKTIEDELFSFNDFELLVGANNSGKSTILQAMAIWQYCIEQFRVSNRNGKTGIQVVLPNFTALPLPEFLLLWKDRTERKYPIEDGVRQKRAEYILIDITLFWKDEGEEEQNFGVQLRYQTPQSIYAIPKDGWPRFNELDAQKKLPHIVYVPPFSGIEPHEQWFDDGNIRQQVGKSQPGSVIRNLLFRVVDCQDENGNDIPPENNPRWLEIQRMIQKWFGVKLLIPQYKKRISTEIKVLYESNGKTFDIISAGSGFHQILILLAFYYGYDDVTTILFDEPDAHLHANLQQNILNYFLSKKEKQFIIASHSTEFIRGTDMHSIISVLAGTPRRVNSTESVIQALSCVDNEDVVRTQDSPYVLYLEGDDDNRILAAWAETLKESDTFAHYYPYILHGTSKEDMKNRSQVHFEALKQINPNLKRVLLLDYDGDETFHPGPGNPCLKEWKRKNIDNYLMVADAWKRAVAKNCNDREDSLLLQPLFSVIDEFFEEQNLTLPKNASWKNLRANVFAVVDGKKLLFENSDSLFHRLKEASVSIDNPIVINRQNVASAMGPDEIHQDVVDFFSFLKSQIEDA